MGISVPAPCLLKNGSTGFLNRLQSVERLTDNLQLCQFLKHRADLTTPRPEVVNDEKP